MLLHAPYGGREGRKGAWKALVESVEEGKVRSIGVSNYGVKHLDEMEEYMKELEEEGGKGKGGVISVGQWEIHPVRIGEAYFCHLELSRQSDVSRELCPNHPDKYLLTSHCLVDSSLRYRWYVA